MAVRLCWCLVATLCLWSASVSSETQAGGKSEVDLGKKANKARIQDLLDFAVKEYNKISNDLYFYKQCNTISAQTQVVSGVKYYIIANIVRTQCAKNRSSGYGDGASCDVACSDGAQVYVCQFEVWVRVWLEGSEKEILLSSSCNPSNENP
ncbi:cystatin-like [Pseudophryne corroboree]|uniref:cystatin-like n=1 Tax=Pseudophryne corroboree TaxID=495146 RepID=UPI00308138EF